MPIFYVPVVLVIGAQDEGSALGIGDDIINNVVDLEPKDLLGMVKPDGLAVSSASNAWFLRDQAVLVDGDSVRVIED